LSKIPDQTAAQHSVHPTSGIRRVFKQFSTPQQNPALKQYLIPPTCGERKPLRVPLQNKEKII